MNCPFLNDHEPRCSECLNMKNLEDAFELCADQYMFCPLFLELSRNRNVQSAGIVETVDKNISPNHLPKQ